MELKQVHEDERRSIHVISDLLEDNKEFSIIKLNKFKAIGGCMHNNDEYMCVIKGCVVVRLGEIEKVMLPGDGCLIESGVPHAFFADEDSIICEWGITEEEKKENKKDETLLKLVNEFNEITTRW